MSLTSMFITNNVEVALIAENCGVDRIWIDLEKMGKEERQKGMNTVKSNHTIEDVRRLAGVLKKAELMVRIDPWHNGSEEEIERVIAAGAQRIMLPMWRSAEEADAFLRSVGQRVRTTLLLEHKDAVDCVDKVLENPLLDEIHIGLNDLHLSYGLDFMFELLANGTVDKLCKKFADRKIPYGFGGVARLGEGTIPAEKIIMEHYRLGSTRVILSRSFCNVQEMQSVQEIEKIFVTNIGKMRKFEESVAKMNCEDFARNREEINALILETASRIKEKKIV